MNRQDELTKALIDGYQRAGKEVGYWAKRFLQAVNRNGGLATAKRMLHPRNMAQRKGLDAMLNANRPDLTFEAIILREFRSLFTEDELKVAEDRLGEYGKEAGRRLYPEELEPEGKYVEGARKTIHVNTYERDPRAREECLKHHGFGCAVCGLVFEQRYGDLGKHFIHVHHLKPLALCDSAYELNAKEDLRPVCPNCHAMLHRVDKKTVLTIEELKARMAKY